VTIAALRLLSSFALAVVQHTRTRTQTHKHTIIVKHAHTHIRILCFEAQVYAQTHTRVVTIAHSRAGMNITAYVYAYENRQDLF
jgi:uncharacterized protein YdiU (UPF0061 family)